MAKTLIVLHDALKRIDVSAYSLAMECKVRQNTIYDIEKNDAIMIKLEVLTKMIIALNKFAKDKGYNIEFTYNDIYKLVDEEEYDRYIKMVDKFYEEKARARKAKSKKGKRNN